MPVECFAYCEDPQCKIEGDHWHGRAFRDYFRALTEEQRYRLGKQAVAEQRSMAAIAHERGVE